MREAGRRNVSLHTMGSYSLGPARKSSTRGSYVSSSLHMSALICPITCPSTDPHVPL